MKRIIVTGAVAAIAAVSFAGTASAAPTLDGPQCFGQIHKAVNGGFFESDGINNVGQLLKAKDTQGQGKKELVNTTYCP